VGGGSSLQVGADGSAYDAMQRAVGSVLFAGEHTCKSHPDTVGGAMLTGLAAARDALEVRHVQSGAAPHATHWS
jgi:hypothetical protein